MLKPNKILLILFYYHCYEENDSISLSDHPNETIQIKIYREISRIFSFSCL